MFLGNRPPTPPLSLYFALRVGKCYVAESVFAIRLVNLRSVTCYTDQNFKENAHFGALNLFTSEKRLKLSYKTSINLEDLDFDFVLQHFTLCLFVNEGDEETNS